jgi:hypothetical protein
LCPAQLSFSFLSGTYPETNSGTKHSTFLTMKPLQRFRSFFATFFATKSVVPTVRASGFHAAMMRAVRSDADYDHAAKADLRKLRSASFGE